MSDDTVGVRELRQNLSKYLRRVEKGERLTITDRNRPVATLAPLSDEDFIDQLVAEGRATRPLLPFRVEDINPIEIDAPVTTAELLEDVRADWFE